MSQRAASLLSGYRGMSGETTMGGVDMTPNGVIRIDTRTGLVEVEWLGVVHRFFDGWSACAWFWRAVTKHHERYGVGGINLLHGVGLHYIHVLYGDIVLGGVPFDPMTLMTVDQNAGDLI